MNSKDPISVSTKLRSGSAGVPPAVPGILPGTRRTSLDVATRNDVRRVFRGTRNTADGTPALPERNFVLTEMGSLLFMRFSEACR